MGFGNSNSIAYICNDIPQNTESVSLFSSCERRKFDRRESKQTSSRVVPYGYRRGAVAYFIFKVSYDLQF